METSVQCPHCACGRGLATPDDQAGHVEMDVACSCGRRVELKRQGSAWAIAAMMTPERSVPISGFSREIRMDPQAERYHFLHSIGGAQIPVHVVYCASSRVAEVKAAGMKVSALLEVDDPLQARRKWVERFEALRRRSKPGPGRLAESFQRTGRRPVARPG